MALKRRYLGKFSAICGNILGCKSVLQGEMFDEKRI
jgi:hypothetical protein